jgi:cobalt-zinc-cadmium efflux system outer membrane protein
LRYGAGSTAQADVFRAQTQISLVDTRLVQIQQERRLREAEINALLNRPTGSTLGRPTDPHSTKLDVTEEEILRQARTVAPSLSREQKKIEGAGLAMALARKDYYPDVTLNAGFYSMGSMGQMYALRADITVPLRRSRTRSEIAEKGHELAQAKSMYENSARSLEFQIHENYLAAETAQQLASLYQDTLLPQARLTQESALSSYESGASDFAGVLANYVAAIEFEMNYHEQVQDFHLALARLEEITGVELIQ